MLNIIKHNWNWRFTPSKRKKTLYIILHHSAADVSSPEQIHQWHLQRDNGTWAGIGYNFVVRKNGEVHEGRPIDASGAHTYNYNSISVGVCFEGNYETTSVMPSAQVQAGRELLAYLKKYYPSAQIKCHRDFQSTACPGKFFPLGELLNYNAVTAKAPKDNITEKRIKAVDEIPDNEMRKIITVLRDAKIICGTGAEKGLDLSFDMLRCIVICYRMFKVLYGG